MYSDTGDTTSLVPGFPIRTSSDPRSVDSSPRHNAASHVLHRLPVPRHPPCALKHLQHKTVKNSRKNQKLHYLHTQKDTNPHKEGQRPCVLDARNHYPQIKHHTPPPRWSDNQVLSPVSHTRDEEIAGLLSQSPIACLMINFDRCFPTDQRLSCTRTTPTTGVAHPTNRPRRGDPRYAGRPGSGGAP